MRPVHASRLAWWSRRRPEPVARRAWERLAAAGAAGDPAARHEVVVIATAEGLTDHPRRAAAGAAVASWWVRSRDPDLREVVRTHRLLAAPGPDRWVTYALHNLLPVRKLDAAAAVPRLLTDADPAVREGAAAACAQAAEPVLGALWRAVDDTSGLEALARNPNHHLETTLEIAIARSANVPGEWLVATAMAAQTPERLRPALVAACRERDLAPADPAERAAFYLITGQLDRYRAADPDGALVTAAYEGAADGERVRLRTAMIKSGDLDLIRMLAGGDGRWRADSADDAERAAIVRVLAARANWPELWRITLDLPLSEAVAAIRLFDGWRPADEAGRELFDGLARTDPDRLATAIADASSPLRLRLDAMGDVMACAVSPDGSRLAVATRQGATEAVALIDYALPSGRRLAEHVQRSPPTARLWMPGFQEWLASTQEWRRELHQVAFTGPESIVTFARNRTLTSWRLTGAKLTGEKTTQIPRSRDLIAIPRHDLIALRVQDELRFLDATTLEPARSPVEPERDWSRSRLWSSPSGEHLVFVLEDGHTVEVHGPPDPIAAPARRPLGETTPADLATVEEAFAEPDGPRAELLEPLRACLRHRFGSAIALGSVAPPVTDHDITLGGQ